MGANRQAVERLAARYRARGNAVGWFDPLYRHAGGDPAMIPWADMKPNPGFLRWADTHALRGDGRPALVVGCGLGDDAEALAGYGFEVTAIDVAPTAIGWCRERFAGSPVAYMVGDFFDLRWSWRRRFDLILEAYTLQVLPPPLQRRAMSCIADCLAPGGTLLVIARGRGDGEPAGMGLHWRLSRADLDGFTDADLAEVAFEDYLDGEDPPVRRFRVEYRR